MWKPSPSLADALHPSTSKDHVLPRLERSIFVDKSEILNNLTALESMQSVLDNYFDRIQTEITPPMRTMLLEWILEVCEEERCSCEVFPLAASYIDRFLSVEVVHKNQLQALGTACLFLASKVKLVNQFAASRLVDYTDEAVSLSEILSWEMLVLNRLNWNVSTLTPLDFLDQYLHRLQLPNKLIARMRSHLNYMVALSVIDFPMATLPPSITAASCLQVAVTHILGDAGAGRQIVGTLKELVDLNMEMVEIHAARIHELFLQKQSDGSKTFLTSSTDSWCYGDSKQLICETSHEQESSSGVNGTATLTPTEIEDVVLF